MGESILAPPVVEDEMKGLLNSNGPALDVSVSFGRFESDSLSWEKWSTFSPNKYLDEVEKCATPGSVAQKKAYFEAHYKKIAARKMEEIEQEKEKEANILNKDGQHGEDHVETAYEHEDKVGNRNVFQNNSNSDESKERLAITMDSQSSIIDETYEELSKIENSVLVQEETQVNGIQKNEADCKKIFACKIEEMEQEKPKEVNFSNKNDQDGEYHVEKMHACDDQAKNINIFQNNSNCDESNESSTITIDSQCSVMDEIVDSRSSTIEETNEESSKVEEPVLVQGVTQINENQEKIEFPPVIDEKRVHSDELLDKAESLKKFQKKIGKSLDRAKGKVDLDASKKSVKMAHSGKEKSLTVTKKKLVPHLPKKIPEISTPKTQKSISVTSVATPPCTSTNHLSKTSKPISSSSLLTPSSSSRKKTNSSSLPKTKKIAPSSLHMSLSLAPTNDVSPSLPTNRSSLIMEKMADKDIVQRAFKSFQKSFNQGGASRNQSSSGHNEVLTFRPDQKASTHPSEFGGMRRGVGKMDVQSAQLGKSLNSTLPGLAKGVGMDQRHAKPAPSSSSIKSGEQRRDISNKLVEQSSVKEAERARLGSKEMETEIKRLRQSLSFKATPMPSFYRGHATSKLVQ